MRRITAGICLALAALLLSGCMMQTVDKMYTPPKRSEAYYHLQKAIDRAMDGLSYCAPLTGENQQTVQMADLDGDGYLEYLLFAKGVMERPLRILIFRQAGEEYTLMQTIESHGSAFDQVEYVQMDGQAGLELVVGCQLSDQVLRSVSVYTFSSGHGELLMTANYSNFLCTDLDQDTYQELFLLRSGEEGSGNGIAAVYGIENGAMARSNEAGMSGPIDKLKRIITGNLHGGAPGVYVASAVEENAVITDVYAWVQGELRNVSFSNESGTSVQTLRNYYVYAEDIDEDNEVELPDLISMEPMGESQPEAARQYLIRWYAMGTDGSETDKRYTYHNFVGGWYLELEEDWVDRLLVSQEGNEYGFYLNDPAGPRKLWTVSVLTGSDRETMATEEGRFPLYQGDTVVYAACLGTMAGDLGITSQALTESFHLIRQPWKTGET